MTSLSFIMFHPRNVTVGFLTMQEEHESWCAKGTVANRWNLEIAEDEVFLVLGPWIEESPCATCGSKCLFVCPSGICENIPHMSCKSRMTAMVARRSVQDPFGNLPVLFCMRPSEAVFWRETHPEEDDQSGLLQIPPKGHFWEVWRYHKWVPVMKPSDQWSISRMNLPQTHAVHLCRRWMPSSTFKSCLAGPAEVTISILICATGPTLSLLANGTTLQQVQFKVMP